MTDTTMTLRLSSDLKTRLEAISVATKRSKSFLASEAVSRYIESEEGFIAGVKTAQSELRAGHGVAHSSVMDDLDLIIDQADRAQIP